MTWTTGAIISIVVLIAGLHWCIRLHPLLSYRRLILRALAMAYPDAIKEIRQRERLSVWHKTARSTGDQCVWGYVDRHSIDPGEDVRLMLSAAPGAGEVAGRVEVYRIGYEQGSDRRLTWQSPAIQVSSYATRRAGRNSILLDNTAAALGPNWSPSLVISKTHLWESGYYSIDFVGTDSSRDADIAFVVVTDPKRSGDVLVKLATSTYQAYNRWGGHSLYDNDDDPLESRGHMVSFDRPTRSEFWEWEYYFVLWLEALAHEEGFQVSYATNFDIATDAAFTSNYKLFISVGHDEYWSKEEFERTYDRIFRKGGNTLFLGSNTAYWQVRYADVNGAGNEGRQLLCYKSLNEPVRVTEGNDRLLYLTARFRDAARRPETMLMGVAYQSNLKDRHHVTPPYSYYVERTDFPFFAGTGYKEGDVLAEIIGHEWDNRDPEADFAPPGESAIKGASRLWRDDSSSIEPIPLERISVLFSGDVIDLHGRKGRAEAVYFESPAGAKVFSSGTNRWTWGLGKEGFSREQFKLFNRNLVLCFLQPSNRASTDAHEQTEHSRTLAEPSPAPCA